MRKTKSLHLLCLLILLLFVSCKTDKEVEQDIDRRLIGKWKLTNSVNLSDSIFLGLSCIEMKSGNSFTSNTSFFWRNDSTRFNPLSGSYHSIYYSDPLGLSRHAGPYTDINLTVDTISKHWVLYGLTDSIMWWTKDQYGDPAYDWVKMK